MSQSGALSDGRLVHFPLAGNTFGFVVGVDKLSIVE
jgi:hypothetical protein